MTPETALERAYYFADDDVQEEPIKVLEAELDRLRAENEHLRNDNRILEAQRDHLLGEA